MGDLNNVRGGSKANQRNKFGTSTGVQGSPTRNEFFLPGMTSKNETKGSGYRPQQGYKSSA